MSKQSAPFQEITNWVVSHGKTPPKTLLSALVGNAAVLARTLGISREGFLNTVAQNWDDVAKQAREKMS